MWNILIDLIYISPLLISILLLSFGFSSPLETKNIGIQFWLMGKLLQIFMIAIILQSRSDQNFAYKDFLRYELFKNSNSDCNLKLFDVIILKKSLH